MLNRKRKSSWQISNGKSKSINKSQLKLSKDKLITIKKFVAKLREDKTDKNNNIEDNKEIKEILKGGDIIFEFRKNKAQKLFEEINQLDINDEKNHEIIKNKINKALSYDNINKENIYKSIKYFLKINDQINYNNALNKAKYCLTKKFNFACNNNDIIQNIDLSKEINIPKDFVIFEDEEALINEIKNALSYLELINEEIEDIKNEKLTKAKILKSKIIEKENGLFTIEKKNSKDDKLQKIYDHIYSFLFYYMFINEFQYYGINQPLDYDYNPTIYLINVFYRIFYNATIISKFGKSKFININEKIMKKLYSLKDYKNHIFDLLKNNNNKINKEIDDKFEKFFYYLESENFPDDLTEIMNMSITDDKPLDSDIIKKFINNKKDEKKKYSFDDKILYFSYGEDKYQYKYRCYNYNLLEYLENTKNPKLLKDLQWNKNSMISYFDEDDISYLKFLLEKILNSKLFKEVYAKYSDINNYIDYYFNEKKNIEDMLNRIKFFPFNERYTGRQAGTIPKHLKIITSSYNVSNIENKKDFINYKLLEMGRKLIIILHEIIHFIKRALNLITNGKVLGTTIESEKEDPDITEGGRYFEELIFNFQNPYIKKRASKRAKSSKKKNDNNEEEDCTKILNIKKALKLLDPNSYDKNIEEFKKYFQSEEENKMESMDSDLKEYIKKINFDLNDYYKNKKSYEKYKINCSRRAITSYIIEYVSYNHNYPYRFNEPKIKFFK